jgi:hypothetical protein
MPMTGRRKIGPCPQHAVGKTPVPTYLLRSCPICMKHLGQHPEAAKLVRSGVPGARNYRFKQSALG